MLNNTDKLEQLNKHKATVTQLKLAFNEKQDREAVYAKLGVFGKAFALRNLFNDLDLKENDPRKLLVEQLLQATDTITLQHSRGPTMNLINKVFKLRSDENIANLFNSLLDVELDLIEFDICIESRFEKSSSCTISVRRALMSASLLTVGAILTTVSTLVYFNHALVAPLVALNAPQALVIAVGVVGAAMVVYGLYLLINLWSAKVARHKLLSEMNESTPLVAKKETDDTSTSCLSFAWVTGLFATKAVADKSKTSNDADAKNEESASSSFNCFNFCGT